MLLALNPVFQSVVLVLGIMAVGAIVVLLAKPDESDQSSKSVTSSGSKTTGPLACPYCKHLIASDVAYESQQVSCPQCHSQFRAPNWRGFTADPGFQAAMVGVVLGLISIVSGACMMWWAFFG